ncbi:hypothetical protein, partial [Paracraurococcus ruber]|nr:hypothetical protein [Paracraurococcus ruber]
YNPPEALPPPPRAAGAPLGDRHPVPTPLGWLRDHASYLLAPGLWSLLAAIGMLLRKLVANILTIAPVVVLAAVLVGLLGRSQERVAGWLAGKMLDPSGALPALLGLPLLLLVLVCARMERRAARHPAQRGMAVRARLDALGAAVILALLAALLLTAPLGLLEFAGLLRGGDTGLVTLPALAVVIGSLLLATLASRIRGRAGRIVISALGLLFAGGLLVLIALLADLLATPAPGGSTDLTWLWPQAGAASPATLLLLAAGLAAAAGWLAWVAAPGGARLLPRLLPAALLLYLALGTAAPPVPGEPVDWPVLLGAGLAALAARAVIWRLIDPNATSLHGFYRDRLADAFLGDPRGLSAGGERRIGLSDLLPAKTDGPFPILNATVNGAPSSELARRGRRAAPFTITPLEAGNITLDYCDTAALERAAPDFDAAAAIALSGAALSPNAGSKTGGGLDRFVKGLLNVRTGRWLPAPIPARGGRTPRPPLDPRQFLLELTGIRRTTPEDRWVFVSDGGHFENLGLVSLLHRRCALVLVVDAEADPRMTLNGLAVATRIARLDLGAEVELDTAPLRPDAQGCTAAHVLEGRIRYRDDDPVWPGGVARLVYVKASVTGDEAADVLEYRSRYADFPQETTADQFFSEEQFEAYRRLGWHMAAAVVDDAARQAWPARAGDGPPAAMTAR